MRGWNTALHNITLSPSLISHGKETGIFHDKKLVVKEEGRVPAPCCKLRAPPPIPLAAGDDRRCRPSPLAAAAATRLQLAAAPCPRPPRLGRRCLRSRCRSPSEAFDHLITLVLAPLVLVAAEVARSRRASCSRPRHRRPSLLVVVLRLSGCCSRVRPRPHRQRLQPDCLLLRPHRLQLRPNRQHKKNRRENPPHRKKKETLSNLGSQEPMLYSQKLATDLTLFPFPMY